MAGIYGALGLQDNDRSFVNTVGQRVAYDAAQEYLQMAQMELDAAYSAFIQGTTTEYSEKYKLPGGGHLQRLGQRSSAGSSKTTGAWDVSYPLESFGAALEFDKVAIGYLTVEQFQNELDTVRIRNINTTRFEILKALFNNTARTFDDPVPGVPALTIQPLANGDTVLYPPKMGYEDEATELHYIVSGFTPANISDANNPFPIIRQHLEEHFGMPSGYGNIAAMIHTNQVTKVEDLSDFYSMEDTGVDYGDDSDFARMFSGVPGRPIGRCNGVWVFEWPHIPTGYILAIDPEQPAPLKQRVDIPEANLPSVLTLVAEDMKHPLTKRSYERRFGVGVANRLNGVVMELTTDPTYDIPTAFA